MKRYPRPDDEIDEDLWVRVEGYEGLLLILGNAHTHRGRISVWSDALGFSTRISKYDVDMASEKARAWIEGFVAASEPSLSEYYGHDNFADDDPLVERWRRACARFRERGSIGRIKYDPGFAIPPGVPIEPQIWHGGWETTYLWNGTSWELADETASAKDFKRGKACEDDPTCDPQTVEVAPDLWLCPECGQMPHLRGD